MNKKPFYKKWWFWLIVIIIICSFGNSEEEQDKATQESFKVSQSQKIKEKSSDKSTSKEKNSDKSTKKEKNNITKSSSSKNEPTEEEKQALKEYEEGKKSRLKAAKNEWKLEKAKEWASYFGKRPQAYLQKMNYPSQVVNGEVWYSFNYDDGKYPLLRIDSPDGTTKVYDFRDGKQGQELWSGATIKQERAKINNYY